MTALPRQIHPNGFPHIAERSAKLEAIAVDQGGKAWAEYREDVDRQNAFLEAFRKNFSIKRSIIAADTDHRHYSKWRADSIDFVTEFNAIIDEWHDEIYISAASRAKGYLVKDENSESGYAEDADGNPIYHNADTKLTTMFIKSMYPDEFNEKITTEHKGSIGIADMTDTQLDLRLKEMMKQLNKGGNE